MRVNLVLEWAVWICSYKPNFLFWHMMNDCSIFARAANEVFGFACKEGADCLIT